MASFNKVILAGNLTRDPELRYTPKGTAVARLALATSRKWRTETNELKEEVTFVDIEAFGKTAEVLGQYMKKSKPILIEGRLKLDQWEDKSTGQKKQRLGVVLETFQFLDTKSGSEFGVQGSGSAEPAREVHGRGGSPQGVERADLPPGTHPAGEEPPNEGDDVPF